MTPEQRREYMRRYWAGRYIPMESEITPRLLSAIHGYWRAQGCDIRLRTETFRHKGRAIHAIRSDIGERMAQS